MTVKTTTRYDHVESVLTEFDRSDIQRIVQEQMTLRTCARGERAELAFEWEYSELDEDGREHWLEGTKIKLKVTQRFTRESKP